MRFSEGTDEPTAEATTEAMAQVMTTAETPADNFHSIVIKLTGTGGQLHLQKRNALID